MIRSMTGFGRCEMHIDGRDIAVEIKGVNHRYFEFGCRLSRGYNFLEERLKKHISQNIFRGKVDVYVSISDKQNSATEITVNHNLALGYVNALRELRDVYGLVDDISVSTIAKYSDIFTVAKQQDDEEEIWSAVLQVVNGAVDKFVQMREAEGQKLYDDIMLRANKILSIVSDIEERSPQTVAEYSNRLYEKIKEVLDNNSIVDEQRVLTEVAIFADKVAVAEETVRLRSHFDQFKNMFANGGTIGRKLDFILQEMNRESNTIGSKCVDKEIAYMVVEIKAELEKIREQIQNIE